MGEDTKDASDKGSEGREDIQAGEQQPPTVERKEFRDGELAEVEEENVKDFYCGVRSWRPDMLQTFTTIACFTGVYSISGLLTSTLSVYINSQITTLEKQFGFSSAVSGFILSCNDIGYLMTTLIMSYLARRAHIPVVLAALSMIFGVSGILCAVPHFVSLNDWDQTPVDKESSAPTPTFGPDLCLDPSNVTWLGSRANGSSCQRGSGGAQGLDGGDYDPQRNFAIAMISIGMILQGVAKSPRSPFIATYIDDNGDKVKTSMYIGIIVGLGIFGPVVAFTLGGLFSRIYVTLEPTDLSPRDPDWIGAWWLGFMVFGICAIMAAVPLFLFPKRLRPRNKAIQSESQGQQRKKLQPQDAAVSLMEGFKGVVAALQRLSTNVVFMGSLLGSGIHVLAVGGSMAFLAKYLQSQYNLPAWKANLILGVSSVLTKSVGTMTGGFVTSRLRLRPLTCLKLLVVFSTGTLVLTCFNIMLGCPQPEFVGHGPLALAQGGNSSAGCLAGCHCTEAEFFPICGADNRNYYSPCHAGCSVNAGKRFENCSCVGPGEGGGQWAEPGLCETECSNLIPFIIINFIVGFLVTFPLTMNYIVKLRCVEERDKPFAIGLSSFAATLLGWLPGPVIYGKLLDGACIIWASPCSGRSRRGGSCSLYDIADFRYRFWGAYVLCKFIGLLFRSAALAKAMRDKNAFYNNDIYDKKKKQKLDKEMVVVASPGEKEKQSSSP